ncbi:MAG: hypothetical protein V5783_09765 [Pontiella sp.]
MNLAALIAYGVVNASMIAYYLLSGKTRYFEFPLWGGLVGLGWFLPQAIGAYRNIESLPEGFFVKGMLFATVCTLAMCGGFRRGFAKSDVTWLKARYDSNRMYFSCTALCLAGFLFLYKLETLPEEMLNSSQWTGPPVMYLFLSGMFALGFIGLFIQYLNQDKWFNSRYILLIPSLLLLLMPVLLHGRRGQAMNLIAYTIFILWFVRRVAVPRVWIGVGIMGAILLVNAIGLFRSAMGGSEGLPLGERLQLAVQQDYLEANKALLDKPGAEFKNYIYRMAACEKLGAYDYGLFHWNKFVFNYIPAQLVGRSLKQGLMVDFIDAKKAGKLAFGYTGPGGATQTGYLDAYASFGYFGFVKFWIGGWIMGTLYRHAMMGFFLPQLLYVMGVRAGVEGITHSTNEILIRIWVYFFIFAYIPFYWSKIGNGNSGEKKEVC